MILGVGGFVSYGSLRPAQTRVPARRVRETLSILPPLPGWLLTALPLFERLPGCRKPIGICGFPPLTVTALSAHVMVILGMGDMCARKVRALWQVILKQVECPLSGKGRIASQLDFQGNCTLDIATLAKPEGISVVTAGGNGHPVSGDLNWHCK